MPDSTQGKLISGIGVVGGCGVLNKFYALAMCEAKDFPPSERDELMGLVTQLQGQVAQLTAANEELHKQLAELKRAGKRVVS